MENEDKIFHSDISRVSCNDNHLYDLLKIEPATPVIQLPQNNKSKTWEFIPNDDKQYIPKKGSKLKVKTVKDIRTLFEKDVYSYLWDDLERQQNYLLRKIRDGNSCDENTKKIASNLFNAHNPISRSAWQMLVNMNPGKYNHPKQFVLWNGTCIQVNGSRGGKTKFICNYDLKHNKKHPLKSTSNMKKTMFKTRMGLLRNSLNVKFKPGPLGKKMYLDDSYHKYHMDHIDLVKLPTPALEISPTYGTVIEPVVSSFINHLRGETGIISHNLAEFAVSVLGTIKDKTPAQLDTECCITFDLNYKCHQNRILMRRNIEETIYMKIEHNSNKNVKTDEKTKLIPSQIGDDRSFNVSSNSKNDPTILTDVKNIINEMICAVEISLTQDSMYSAEYESIESMAKDCEEVNSNGNTKDKPKNKYCELDRLAVTVIKLPESSQKDITKPCGKSFCSLGCICESLSCGFRLKQHCGAIDCMFKCKCEVTMYKDIELLDRDCSEIIPGLLNLDNEINSQLAKEEQKFHQTVVVSGDRSILLKPRKRNCKSSTKYAEFYSKMNLKGDEKIKRILTVNVKKLNCDHIEPFCMVHNLYKCFCKGKFTETHVNNVAEIVAPKILHNEQTKKVEQEVTLEKNNDLKSSLRPRQERKDVVSSGINDFINLCDSKIYKNLSGSSARTMGYSNRKYTDEYYKNTNDKISEMEKNDLLLKKRMLRLINGANADGSKTPESLNMSSESTNSNDKISETEKNDYLVRKKMSRLIYGDNTDGLQTPGSSNNSSESTNQDEPINKTINTEKSALSGWLESSYKSYKQRLVQGVHKDCLEPPKKGKAVLHNWDFILSRYKQRKNLFFVSKQEPFHTYLGVDKKHPWFANCINIDHIPFTDLPKYPVIITKLVTNATEPNNSFCILRGWDACWELIGSAVKVFEHTANESEANETFEGNNIITQDNSLGNENDDWVNQNIISEESCMSKQEDSKCNETDQETQKKGQDNSERSKWFVMTVENDFTEIQFYKRGFYVTYDGIQRSICLARISGKTVRLSSQARTDKHNTQHFGIYAIPSTDECCVFIGPYEVNEPLGIEVVKTFSDPTKQRKTRGIWIITNKVDNMKVIEHPLAFMPNPTASNEAIVTLDSSLDTATNAKQSLNQNESEKQTMCVSNLQKNTSAIEISKTIKPIKIRRTNGFYHLSSNSILQKISPNKATSLFINKSTTHNNKSIETKNTISLLKNPEDGLRNNSEEFSPNTPKTYSKPFSDKKPRANTEESNLNTSITYKQQHNKPVAEIAPQIKIISVYSESNTGSGMETSEHNKTPSMLILKPEEINKKLLAHTVKDEITTDIEHFLETSLICAAPQDDVFVISDGEDEVTNPWKDVWVQCRNVDNFGCIRGRVNNDDLLSFEFPGFKYSAFYPESQAFYKINQVLARKIYIPKNVKLLWQVVENIADLRCKVLTTELLREKKYLLIKLREHRNKNKVKKTGLTKTYSRIRIQKTDCIVLESDSEEKRSTTTCEKTEIIKALETTSRKLEDQSTFLWNEAIMKRDEIATSLAVPNNLKTGMTEQLQDIISMID